ncbi:MAG: hypothetical protein LBH06_08070 [Rikenellaceae bacterium]|jgi:hypothetical protein|nr:hypothetical protein [Rikenellaceae bacterium]
MANSLYILAEGEGDKRFLEDYINQMALHASVEIQQTGGWTNLKNMQSTIERKKGDGKKVLVIFDADTPDNEGGFVKRKKEIEDCKLPLDGVFLLPDNGSDGMLEDLLEKVINPDNKFVFDCWSKYEKPV